MRCTLRYFSELRGPWPALATPFAVALLVAQALALVLVGVPGGPGIARAQTAAAPARIAPELVGISRWFNTPPLSLAGLRGKVVLVDFWTLGCSNCIHTLPHVQAWHRRYKDQGLVVIGVHTPEFAFEREPANVQAAIQRFGLGYPVALDNDSRTWNAWHNAYWPALYLIDKQGRVVYQHVGEGAYDLTEARIQQALQGG